MEQVNDVVCLLRLVLETGLGRDQLRKGGKVAALGKADDSHGRLGSGDDPVTVEAPFVLPEFNRAFCLVLKWLSEIFYIILVLPPKFPTRLNFPLSRMRQPYYERQ
jgi:hypothetical protein